jgi:hypothetical protein
MKMKQAFRMYRWLCSFTDGQSRHIALNSEKWIQSCKVVVGKL